MLEIRNVKITLNLNENIVVMLFAFEITVECCIIYACLWTAQKCHQCQILNVKSGAPIFSQKGQILLFILTYNYSLLNVLISVLYEVIVLLML
jgi:hypothetical protein